MEKREKIFVYIDGANLHKGVDDLGWRLDYQRFQVWLTDKYGAARIYLFLGLVPKYKALYTELQEFGYTLVFKETIYDGSGQVKGNCDADLVLKVVCDFYEKEFSKAIIVAGDGDYACLAQFLKEKNGLGRILAPNYKKCSILLKRTGAIITFLNEFKEKLEKVQNEKAPNADGTASGSFS